jgi:acetylornithine/succinyldiaminopimelate/putrescine aminotransferase
VAPRIARAAFERGLIVETAGPDDEVLKLLPPLTIDPETLQEGLGHHRRRRSCRRRQLDTDALGHRRDRREADS